MKPLAACFSGWSLADRDERATRLQALFRECCLAVVDRASALFLVDWLERFTRKRL